jgi:hypothetical protein
VKIEASTETDRLALIKAARQGTSLAAALG